VRAVVALATALVLHAPLVALLAHHDVRRTTPAPDDERLDQRVDIALVSPAPPPQPPRPSPRAARPARVIAPGRPPAAGPLASDVRPATALPREGSPLAGDVEAPAVVDEVARAAVDGVGRSARTAGSSCRRAIVFRDDVPLEQELGTQAFTEPLLAGYASHAYITGQSEGRAKFTKAMRDAARDGCSVDVFFLVLGADYAQWIEELDARPRVHFVYDTGGGDAELGARFVAAGAETFVGHRGGNIAPVFYAFFLPKLAAGEPIDDAVREANAATRDVIYSSGPLMRLATGDDNDTLWHNTEAVIFR
jgi:hypothetical protein